MYIARVSDDLGLYFRMHRVAELSRSREIISSPLMTIERLCHKSAIRSDIAPGTNGQISVGAEAITSSSLLLVVRRDLQQATYIA